MDPNYPSPPQPGSGTQPQVGGEFGTEPSGQKRFPKKFIFIGIGLILIIIVAVLLIGGGKKDKKEATDQTSRDSSIYIDRAGYKDITDGIGDPTALVATLSDKVINYGGISVIQPCALITLDDIKANGLLINANQLTGPVSRNVYNGTTGQQIGRLSPYVLPSSDELNNCQYYLTDSKVVEVTVMQSYNVNPIALNEVVAKRFTPVADVNGLKVFKETLENKFNKNETTYLIRSANATTKLRIDTDQAVKDKILAKLAENLKKAETTPTPLPLFSYKSPVMSTSVFACC
jgi:hypothetical protein